MTKLQIFTKFKQAKRVITDKHCASSAEEFILRDLEVISLCEAFLLKYPEMNDIDCYRAFYPAKVLANLKEISNAS